MRMSKLFPGLLWLGLGLGLGSGLGGCKTLKEVNDVSNAASANLQQFDQFNTSVTTIYVDDYHRGTYGDYSSSGVGLRTDTPQTTRFFPFTLAQAEKTDTLLRKIYVTLNGYFSGMAKLAADSLIDYTLDTVTDALAGGTLIDTAKISAGTITAIGSIAAKLGQFVSQEYRLRHIKEYITESDPLVQTLVKDLKNSLTDMRFFLSTEKDRLKRDVYEPMEEAWVTSFERKHIVDEYFRVMAEMTNKQRRLDSYMLSLEIIAEAHYYLSGHVDELRSRAVRTKLTHYASVLKDQERDFGVLIQHSSN